MPLSVGTRLGPYEILGLIGTDGMGEVYKARERGSIASFCAPNNVLSCNG